MTTIDAFFTFRCVDLCITGQITKIIVLHLSVMYKIGWLIMWFRVTVWFLAKYVTNHSIDFNETQNQSFKRRYTNNQEVKSAFIQGSHKLLHTNSWTTWIISRNTVLIWVYLYAVSCSLFLLVFFCVSLSFYSTSSSHFLFYFPGFVLTPEFCFMFCQHVCLAVFI